MYNTVRATWAGETVDVDPITMDFVDYSHALGDRKPNPMEFLLFVTYCKVEGTPKNLRQVHEWARANRVIAEEVDGTAPGPTQPDQSPD